MVKAEMNIGGKIYKIIAISKQYMAAVIIIDGVTKGYIYNSLTRTMEEWF